jgi:hypothetical protein
VRVNIDSDGVVYDLTTEMIAVAHARTGVLHPQPDRWSTDEAWGVTYTSELFDHPGIFAQGDPYPGAVEAIESLLAEGHEVRIVTTKHGLPNEQRAMLETIEFYARIGLLDRVDIVFPRGDKTAYPADVVIDDKPTLAWAQPGAVNLLMTQPWNRGGIGFPKPGARVLRVYDWATALFVIGEEGRR